MRMLMGITILNMVVRAYLCKQVTLKQRFEGGKGAWECLKQECHRQDYG